MEIVDIEQFQNFKKNSLKMEVPMMTDQIMATILLVDSNSKTLGLNHPSRDKIYFVFKGSGVITIGKESKAIEKGNLILVPNGNCLTFSTTKDRLELLTIEATHKKIPKIADEREINEAWEKK